MPRLLLVVLALLVAGCGDSQEPAASTRSGWTTFRDERSGLTVRFPSDWHRAAASLTPNLTDPRELLSLGSSSVAPPAEQARCAHLPVAALRATGATDVFVTIQERTGRASDQIPVRQRPFALGPADDSEAVSCAGEPGPWRSHWVSFQDAGRPLYALVLVGDRASPERVAELEEVLDSLAFDRSSRFEAGRGLSGRVPDAWHFIDRQLAAAVSEEDQIAAATFAVPDGPPESNCTPRAALDRMGPADAFVYTFRYTGGSVQLGDFPPRPDRFTLDPALLGGYECMGNSYLVRWREHGMAFQAHVYLGKAAAATRREEALELLDDLIVEE